MGAVSLTQNELLAALGSADLAALGPYLRCVSLQPGDLLQEAEAPVEQVYFPFSGVISLVAIMTNGAVVETAMIGREGAVGAFAGLGPWHAFGRAVVDLAGSAATISAAQFQDIVGKSDALRAVILRYKEVLLAQVQQTAACNVLHPLEARLARWLLQADDRAEDTELKLTQELLSHMLGVRRTTVSVTARLLQHQGLVEQGRGSIKIRNRPGLEATACECYATLRRRARGALPTATANIRSASLAPCGHAVRSEF